MAYIGDDLNDLPVMRMIAPHGLLGAPADAEPSHRPERYTCCAVGVQGGHGAFREFAEFVLTLRDRQTEIAKESHDDDEGRIRRAPFASATSGWATDTRCS